MPKFLYLIAREKMKEQSSKLRLRREQREAVGAIQNSKFKMILRRAAAYNSAYCILF